MTAEGCPCAAEATWLKDRHKTLAHAKLGLERMKHLGCESASALSDFRSFSSDSEA